MQFHHPDILYALLLLLIPVIIHLVRWKKFKTVLFTNVDFLQELEIKSRKSRKLKELIVLLLRLLAFAMLIMAFARPFFPSKAHLSGTGESKNIIYVDNSRSLSVLNGKTSLWQQYLQDISQNLSRNKKYTLLTNEHTFRDITGEEVEKILYETHFSNQPAYHGNNLKKIALLAGETNGQNIHVLYLSDMQNATLETINDSLFVPGYKYYFYPKQIKNIANISIDSIWQVRNTAQYRMLQLKLSANNPELSTQLSIKNGNEVLWNHTIQFKDSLQQNFIVQLPNKNIEGEAVITDNGFQFDNRLYFTLQQPEKIKVLVIGKKLPGYLKKIYTPDEFELEFINHKQLNYNDLDKYQLIIISDFSADYRLSATALQSYLQQYGNLLIIPDKSQATALSGLLQSLQVPVQAQSDTTKVFLNKINYNHPVFEGVFLKKVKNFAYPFVKEHYRFNRRGNWLYQLSDGSPFAQIFGRNHNIFVINAALQPENTDFTAAPSLIVPLLYSIPFHNNKREELYYILGMNHSIPVKAQVSKDDIVRLKSKEAEYIPRQEIRGNKILITAGEEIPEKAGIYAVEYNKRKLRSIAFNYDRKENLLQFIDLPALSNIQRIESLHQYTVEQENLFKEKEIWKWFLWLALLFLLMEMAVIKFWK